MRHTAGKTFVVTANPESEEYDICAKCVSINGVAAENPERADILPENGKLYFIMPDYNPD